MSNSRRVRRSMRRRRRHAETVIADALINHPQLVAESVASLQARERETVQESGVVEAPRADRPGRMLVQLITAGWSANGRYYPAEVLRRDGPNAFPAGTQAFIDHATEMEDAERPAGSVKNLAAVLTGDAVWDEDRQALIAEVRLFEPWRKPLTDMHEHIGMSIRAIVTGEHGEHGGQSGFVVGEIVHGRSVDFVTVPAAGGAILSVLESAQPAQEARNVGSWLESRLHLKLTQLGDDMYGDGWLTRQERITLSAAIGDALQAWTSRVEADAPQLFQRDLWEEPAPAVQSASEAPTDTTRAVLQRAVAAAHPDSWVRDFDPDAHLVWYEAGAKLWQQPYTVTSGVVALGDDRVEVYQSTVYKPVSSPAEPSTEAAPPTSPASAVAGAHTIPVAEMATDLDRLDKLLGHTPTDAPASAGLGQAAGGSPPTAHTDQQEAPMTGQTGAAASEAGTGNEPRTHQPVEAAEAQLAVVAQERDQFRARAHSLAEALTEAQNAQRAAEAARDQAVAESRRLLGNETGRQTVDRMLAADESGVPDSLRAYIAPRVHTAVQDRVPMTTTGEVDQEALESLVTSAIRAERVHAAQLLEAQGVGRVNGLGAEGNPTMQMTAEQFDKTVSKLWADIGLDESTAELATEGR